MLILSRKKNESIIISDNVEVMITDVSGEHVKLGIRAPRHISVHRKEVYEAIRQENMAAAKTKPTDMKALRSLLRRRDS